MSKITIEKSKCIGCGSCAAICDKLFELGEDGKSHLKGANPEPEREELELKDAGCAREAVEICPAQCIHLK